MLFVEYIGDFAGAFANYVHEFAAEIFALVIGDYAVIHCVIYERRKHRVGAVERLYCLVVHLVLHVVGELELVENEVSRPNHVEVV